MSICGRPKQLILLVVASIGIGGGCARRVVGVAPAAVVANDVSPLVQRGCYRCLEQAFARAQALGVRAQAFEVAALLSLRSKELGLPHHEWRRRARAIATGASEALALEIIDALPIDPLSDREASIDFARRARLRTNLTPWRASLQTGETSALFRAYVDAALVCAALGPPERDAALAIADRPDAPLLQFRIGVCTSAYVDRLRRVRSADATFVDADYYLARHLLEESNPDTDEAVTLLQSAGSAFPQSAAISTLLGQQHQAREEWTDALGAYDRALSASPRAADAALGRTVALTRVGRRDEAIDAATRLIDDGRWFAGEAFYWRAWNELALARLDVARSDADRAKSLMANAAVFSLSGIIDWRLRRLESAEAEFEKAVSMDLGQCEAAQYLGGVRGERARLPEAKAALLQARQCYDLSITLRREAIARILASPAAEGAKSRAAEGQERAIRDIETKRREVDSALAVIEQTLERARESTTGR